MDKIVYKEIASGKINENKSIVISECSKGGYTLGQKLTMNDNGKKVDVFLKGAIHLDSVQSLINIRDAFNETLEKIKENINNSI